MSIILGINHVATLGKDLETSRSFYTDVLGLVEVNQFNIGERHGAVFAFGAFRGRTIATLSVTVAADTGRRMERVAPLAAVFGVRPGCLSGWQAYLVDRAVMVTGRAWAFGEEYLCFTDPAGFDLAMVEDKGTEAVGAATQARRHHPLGPLRLRSVELQAQTSEQGLPHLLTLLGFKAAAQEGPLFRFQAGVEAAIAQIDILCPPRRTAGLGAGGPLPKVVLEVNGAQTLRALTGTLARHPFITRPLGGDADPISIKFAQSGIDVVICTQDQQVVPLLERLWQPDV